MCLEGKSVWTVHCHQDITISGPQTKIKANVNCNSRDLLIEWEVERQLFGGNVDAADPTVSFCHHISTIRRRTALRIARTSFSSKWFKSSCITRDPRKAYFQMLPQSLSGGLNNFIQHFISPGPGKATSLPCCRLPFSFLHCPQLWGFSTRILPTPSHWASGKKLPNNFLAVCGHLFRIYFDFSGVNWKQWLLSQQYKPFRICSKYINPYLSICLILLCLLKESVFFYHPGTLSNSRKRKRKEENICPSTHKHTKSCTQF